MTAYAINFKNSTIRAFTSTSVASKMGNGLVVFTSAEDLLADRNTTGRGLVEVYNNNSDKPVKSLLTTGLVPSASLNWLGVFTLSQHLLIMLISQPQKKKRK